MFIVNKLVSSVSEYLCKKPKQNITERIEKSGMHFPALQCLDSLFELHWKPVWLLSLKASYTLEVIQWTASNKVLLLTRLQLVTGYASRMHNKVGY
jgi:hypothetical protein